MSVLALGNQTSMKDCYDDKKKSFNKNALNRHIANFEGRYKKDSPRVCQLVNNLVETDPEMRQGAS